MNKKTKTLAAYMLAIAGLTFVFTSCNEENEEVMNRKANYKSSISTVSNPYAFYEDNNYSVDEIILLTNELDRQMYLHNMSNWEISDAVVTLEALWNYGLVAKQIPQDNGNVSGMNFELAVNLDNNGKIDGEQLRIKFLQLVHTAKLQADGKNLNMADVSVVDVNADNVVLNISMQPYNGYPTLIAFQGPCTTNLTVINSTAVYRKLPENNIFCMTDSLDDYFASSATPFDLNSIRKTELGSNYYLTSHKAGGPCNIKKLNTATPVLNQDDNPIIIPSVYNSSTGKYTYATCDTVWAKDVYFPALRYTLSNHVTVPSGYLIIDFLDYGYKSPILNATGESVISQDVRFAIHDIKISRWMSPIEIEELLNSLLLDLTAPDIIQNEDEDME